MQPGRGGPRPRRREESGMRVTLAQARRDQALSQQELADAAQVSRTTVTEIESGRRFPQPRTRRALAAALGLQPAQIAWPEPPAATRAEHDA